MHFAPADDLSTWDERLTSNPDGGEFLQMHEFGLIKSRHGWRARHIETDGIAFLALERTIPPFGKLWYIPRGPGVVTVEQLAQFAEEIESFAKQHGVFMVKCEPALERDTLVPHAPAKLHRGTDVQPTYSTVWVDIRPQLDNLEQSFTSKTRYNIRQARKANVRVEEMTPNESTYRAFYELFTETAADRFVIRPYEYYRLFWDTYCANDHGAIFFAYEDDQLVAADFVIINKHRASRKDAGSTRRKTTRGIPALLVLETMRALKARGVTDYDLCGAPESWRVKDQSHPLYGIGTFKTGFSEKITDYVGTYYLAIRPLRALLWHRIAEKVIRKLYFMRHHEGWY